MYKVPFRQVYTETFINWIKDTIWCHLVIKIWPHLIDLGSDTLRSTYVDNPGVFYEQYEWRIKEAAGCNSLTNF